MTTNQQGITFGIELEAVLIFPKSVVEDAGGEADRKKLIGNFIQTELSKPYRSRCGNPECSLEHEFNLPLYDVWDESPSEESFDKWIITEDGSVRPTHREMECPESFQDGKPIWDKYGSQGIEIKSRIMNFNGSTPDPDDPASEHPPHWLHEFRFVTERLEALNQTRDLRCYVNSSSGMHIHLGKGTEGVAFNISRAMMAMFTAFERQIDAVLTTERIGGYAQGEAMTLPSVTDQTPAYQYHDISGVRSGNVFAPEHNYCHPMSRAHLYRVQRVLQAKIIAAQKANDLGVLVAGEEDDDEEMMETSTWLDNITPDESTLVGLDTNRFPYDIARTDRRKPGMPHAIEAYHIPGWLYMIASARNFNHLDSLWPHEVGGHDATLNFDNINEEAPYLKQTIEVRCHPGSLDFHEIAGWIDLMCSMFQYTESALLSEMASLLIRWCEQGFTIAELARAVGATDETQAFYRRRLEPDYAQRAARRNVNIQSRDSPLRGLINFAEGTRCLERIRVAVDERIRHKFEAGAYGLQSRTFVYDTLGSEVANTNQGQRLIIYKRTREAWNRLQVVEPFRADEDTEAAIEALGGVHTDDSDEDEAGIQ